MPTYEYRCVAGHQYEKRESFSARPRQKCQVCGKQADRMIFAPPIVFKGSGFYSTDSRGSQSNGDTPSAAAPAAPEPSSDHGHSHGPGGHSHDAPDPLESAAAS